MELFLEKVTISDKEILYRLLQFSLFEESENNLRDMNDNAIFEYKYFDSYFTDKDRDAYFIRDKKTNNLLGFAMVNTYMQIFKKGHSIAEYMVIPKYRRNKIGKKVAIELFNRYKGNWEVKPLSNSDRAYLFWKNVIEDYTNNNFEFKNGIFIFMN